MEKYTFFDSFDILQNGEYVYTEYELKGEAYREFLRFCFRYCKTMTLLFWDIIDGITDQKLIDKISFKKNDVLEEKIKEFEIEPPKDIQCNFSHYKVSVSVGDQPLDRIYVAETSVKHYKLCPALFELMTTVADDIFSWADENVCGRFEDPCFFREDGSCFCFSIIHEGVLYLYLNENEDPSELFKMSKWWTDEMIWPENSNSIKYLQG